MTKDEERRHVAKRLRGIETVEFDDGEKADFYEVADELWLKAKDGAWADAESVRRLADLIDRPKAERHDGGRWWICKHCGAFNRKDAVLDCCGVIPSRCCGNCGREWENEK